MRQVKKIGIIGATGYSGRELLSLSCYHPHIESIYCFTRNLDWRPDQELSNLHLNKIMVAPITDILDYIDEIDVIFLATPTFDSINLVKKLIECNVILIDLSGAFRNERSEFKKFYGADHTAYELVNCAQYGLMPFAQDITEHKTSKLIANPGCYATSILMSLIPLIRSKLIDARMVVIDAKSGTSGGGRSPKVNLLYNEVAGECLPYKVGEHQHLPEICRFIKQFSGVSIDPFFTTSLLATRRGIISTLYLKRDNLHSNINDQEMTDLIYGSYGKCYENYSLVRYAALTGDNLADSSYLSLKKVVGTAQTHISFKVVGEKIYIFSVIDNLLKGAASQAVENFNYVFDYPASAGIDNLRGVL